MKLQSHLIRVCETITEGNQVVSITSFFRRVSAPTPTEALMIARTRYPGCDVELFDERLFVNDASELRELVSC